jgi:hypothetical protein
MTPPSIIECAVPCRRRGPGASKELHATEASTPEPLSSPPRIPRLARLLALAHRLEALLQADVVADYAGLARLGHVSRARICQIVCLAQLAPDIQEEILFLVAEEGRRPLQLRQVLPIAATLDWDQQRRLWRQLCQGLSKNTSAR